MSCYIKEAISCSKASAYYIGKTDKCAENERGKPKNQLISKFEQEHGKLSWRVLMIIPNHEVHTEFGESFLINCFRKKLNQFTLLNKNIPNVMAFIYDRKSEFFIEKFRKLFV
jgi:hypothetical protein